MELLEEQQCCIVVVYIHVQYVLDPVNVFFYKGINSCFHRFQLHLIGSVSNKSNREFTLGGGENNIQDLYWPLIKPDTKMDIFSHCMCNLASEARTVIHRVHERIDIVLLFTLIVKLPK